MVTVEEASDVSAFANFTLEAAAPPAPASSSSSSSPGSTPSPPPPPAEEPRNVRMAESSPPPSSTTASDRVFASPLARKMLREANIQVRSQTRFFFKLIFYVHCDHILFRSRLKRLVSLERVPMVASLRRMWRLIFLAPPQKPPSQLLVLLPRQHLKQRLLLLQRLLLPPAPLRNRRARQ